jgi:hypothetical protein
MSGNFSTNVLIFPYREYPNSIPKSANKRADKDEKF